MANGFPSTGTVARRLAIALLLGTLASSALAQTVPVLLGPIPPEDVMPLAPGGIDAALATLPATVEDILKRSGVPGAAVAVVRDGKTVFARGFGVRELGKPATIDTETVFQIASLSKPVAATVAAIEVSSGKVRWDDKVVRHLPSFALNDPYVTANVTVGDFYAHRSGLPLAGGDTLEDLGFERGIILERLRMLPLRPFRASYNYANFGYTAGAEAVAAAAGKPWEDLSREVLYAPLGMASTSSRYADFTARPNRAALHAWVDGRFQALYRRDPDQQSPAGGVSSTVLDLAEWMKLILANGRHQGRELIAPDALLPALRPQAFSAPARSIAARSGFYGFGFNVSVGAGGRPEMSHSGAFDLGAATNVQFLPSAGVAIVVLTNGGPVGAAEAIGSHFMAVAQYGAPQRDWYALLHPLLMHYYEPTGDLAGKAPPPSPAPARPLAEYVGTYDSAYFGPARVSQGPDGLVLTLGPAAIAMPMVHWEGDTFAVVPQSENAPAGSRSSVRFEKKGDAVTSVTVDYLNEDGLATWTR